MRSRTVPDPLATADALSGEREAEVLAHERGRRATGDASAREFSASPDRLGEPARRRRRASMRCPAMHSSFAQLAVPSGGGRHPPLFARAVSDARAGGGSEKSFGPMMAALMRRCD